MSSAAASPAAEDKSAESRARILAAALAEFAEQGFAGARVDAIAERAGINKRMLYVYVGNKEALWLATLEQVYEAMRVEERRLDTHNMPPLAGMEALVRFNFRYHVEHPEFVTLVNDENLQAGRNLARSTRVQDLYSPLLALIDDLLRRGQAEGLFRADVDSRQLYVSIAGMGYFYWANRHTLSAIFGRAFDTAAALQGREDHMVEVVLGYFRPIQPQPAREYGSPRAAARKV
jgi:TetR/AcrR family transcriptional regulator